MRFIYIYLIVDVYIMTDVLTKKQRSYNMSRIRSSRTKPELKIKDVLKTLKFSYQPKNVYGRPDFAHTKKKIVVFIDGCFWHKCPKHFKKPKSNKAYWKPKIEKNVLRDKEINFAYKNSGWKVKRIWEHNLKS